MILIAIIPIALILIAIIPPLVFLSLTRGGASPLLRRQPRTKLIGAPPGWRRRSGAPPGGFQPRWRCGRNAPFDWAWVDEMPLGIPEELSCRRDGEVIPTTGEFFRCGRRRHGLHAQDAARIVADIARPVANGADSVLLRVRAAAVDAILTAF